MSKRTYNEEWILEHKDDFDTWHELCDLYNETFGTNITHKNFKHKCSHHMGLSCKGHKYTKEQREWLEQNFPIKEGGELTAEYNKLFGTHKNYDSIRAWCKVQIRQNRGNC